MSSNKKKTATIECENCHKMVIKETKYINSAKRKNRPMFCNSSCSSFYYGKLGKYKSNGNIENLNSRNRTDVYTPYRYYYRKSIQRGKCNLTLDDIKEQWEKQKGICALSGLPIKLHDKLNDIFSVASLDRIDSKKPYQPGNIQFVVLSLNLAKHSSSDLDFRNFILKLKAV